MKHSSVPIENLLLLFRKQSKDQLKNKTKQNLILLTLSLLLTLVPFLNRPEELSACGLIS